MLSKTLNIINWGKRLISNHKNNYTTLFPGEITLPLKMPRRVISLMPQPSRFSERYEKEVLLRHLSKLLIEEYCSGDSLIIDMGAWIGDNAVVWAAMTKERGSQV